MSTAFLPDFLIAGAAKSGTTSVYRALQKHPDLWFPELKEPYYFSFDGELPASFDESFSQQIVQHRHEYEKLFEPAPDGTLTGEASTSYLYTYKTSIPKILEHYENRKLPTIFCFLRNPVDRAVSHHSYLLQRGIETEALREVVAANVTAARRQRRLWDFDYIEYGRYVNQITAYQKFFPNVYVFLYDDLIADPSSVLSEILSLLGVDNIPLELTNANPSGNSSLPSLQRFLTQESYLKDLARAWLPERSRTFVRAQRDKVLSAIISKPKVDASFRLELEALFADEIDALGELLDRELISWKSSGVADG
jgi:hypothetical protein